MEIFKSGKILYLKIAARKPNLLLVQELYELKIDGAAMKKLVIIGGGFAGYWSALAAVRKANDIGCREKLGITVISRDPYLSIRPRFYEQNLEGMQVSLNKYFDPLKVQLILGEVSGVDPMAQAVSVSDRSSPIEYDYLVLAAGSLLAPANTPGIEHAFSVDTYSDALKLDSHLKQLASDGFSSPASRTFVVVGGGFSGLETISELPHRLQALAPAIVDFNFILVEKSPALAMNYSASARQYIVERLNNLKVSVMLSQGVDAIGPSGIRLTSGQELKSLTSIWTAGLQASPLTRQFEGEHDASGRIDVDQYLRLPHYNNVFVAGDVSRALVDQENHALMSCQHAIVQGKVAGHNAASALFGSELVPYQQPRYVTCLDLGAGDAVFTEGWDREMQMHGREAKDMKIKINTKLIYPADSVDDALEMALPAPRKSYKD